MHNHNKRGRKIGKTAGISLGTIALVLTAFVSPPYLKMVGQEIEEGITNVTIEDLREDPEAQLDQTITIRYPISKTIGNTGFSLAEEEDEQEIIVINSTGEEMTVPDEDIAVQVTGKASRLIIADIESEYGIDLEEELYVDYEDKIVVVAQSLALAPTPEQLATNPSAFYDQVVAIEGEVRDILSENSLTLFEEGWIDDVGLLVVSGDPNFQEQGGRLDAGEIVVVTGVVRQEDLGSLNQKYGLNWDEDKITEFENRYSERPIVVADDIYPSAIGE